MASPQPVKAPQSNSVIDTGRSLDKNVTVKNGKVVTPTADIITSPVPAPTMVSGTEGVDQSTTTQSPMTDSRIESKTYFASANKELHLYKDDVGQTWLSTSPEVAGVMLAVLVGLLISPFLVSLSVQKARLKAARRAEKKARLAEMVEITKEDLSPAAEPESVDQPTSPPKFRKISL